MLYKLALAFALVVLLVFSWNAPISGDEYVHVQQAQKVINYFKTLGKDKTVLDTPISRLKHYGQSFDTVTTFIAQFLQVDDLYRFRHMANAFMAWLVILYTSLIATMLSKNRMAGILVILLFLATGRFMGHAMNNLKDIPFAFAYIFSFYHLFRFLVKWPKISKIDLTMLTLGIAMAISIRIGGLLIYALFILFSGLYLYYMVVSDSMKKGETIKLIWSLIPITLAVLLLSCFIGFLIWPWALENMLVNPWKSFILMQDYPTTVRQIFEGKLWWSDQFPWYYLFKYLLITLPLLVLVGFGAFFIFIKKLDQPQTVIFAIFTLIAFGFPLFYAAATGANVYGGWRQMLFVFPPMVVLASLGIYQLYLWAKEQRILHFAVLLFVGLLVYPIYFQFFNYPYQYTFYNPLAGGIGRAYGNYELDYYFTSFKKAYAYLDANHPEAKIVAANFVIPEYYKGKSYKPMLIDYYQRSSTDWDFAVVCNTFLSPHTLKAGLWPPANTIYTDEVSGVPIVAVIKRESKLDLLGAQKLLSGDTESAIALLDSAHTIDSTNESILLNLAKAYMVHGEKEKARSAIDKLLIIYPDNEAAMDMSGEIKMSEGKYDEAVTLFSKVIENNYKYYHAYVNLAKANIALGEQGVAIEKVVKCLRINPFYVPARHLYGRLLIARGDVELGEKMLNSSASGTSKYGIN